MKKTTTYYREDGSVEKIEEIEYDNELTSDPSKIPSVPDRWQPRYPYFDPYPKVYCGRATTTDKIAVDPSASKYVVWNTERDCA